MNNFIIFGVLLIAAVVGASDNSSAKILEIPLTSMGSKFVHKFNSQVVKAEILKKKEIESRVSCVTRQSRIGLLKTNVKNIDFKNVKSTGFGSEYIAVDVDEDYIVLVSISGQIVVLKEDNESYVAVGIVDGFEIQNESDHQLLEAFITDKVVHLVSKKLIGEQEGYFLKTLVIKIQGQQQATAVVVTPPTSLVEDSIKGKIASIRLLDDILLVLTSNGVIHVFQLDSDYKKPRVHCKVVVLNVDSAVSLDVSKQFLFIVDSQKGVLRVSLAEILSFLGELGSSSFIVNGEVVWGNKISSGFIRQYLKPFEGEEFYVVSGTQRNGLTFIDEVKNKRVSSSSIDEPSVKQMVFSQNYVAYVSNDALHVMVLKIDEEKVAVRQKKFSYEVLGIQRIIFEVDQESDGESEGQQRLTIITSHSILKAQLKVNAASLACSIDPIISEEKQSEQELTIELVSKSRKDSAVYSETLIVRSFVQLAIMSEDTQQFIMGFAAGSIVIIGVAMTCAIWRRRKQYEESSSKNNSDQLKQSGKYDPFNDETDRISCKIDTKS